MSITHSTPADGSFSGRGKEAWDAAHTGSEDFTQSGTGPVTETISSRGRWFCYVTDYLSEASRAALRSGSSVDISAALTSALADFQVVFVPPYSSYTVGSKVTVPASKGIYGFNKQTTTITKAFNGDMIDLSANGSFMQGISLAGAGATFTGKGVVMATAGGGKQRIHHCKIDDTAGACIAFDDKDAGSQFSGFDLELTRRNSGTGTGNFSVTVVTTSASAATPRKFSHVETGGGCSFTFGGSNDFIVSDSFIGDIEYHANSKGVHISNCRIANQSSLSILGDNNTICGSGIAPNITLDGVGPFTLQGNTYNGTVTDNTTTKNNVVDAPSVSYTPTWTGSVSDPAIGDGTLRGEYTRTGDTFSVTIEVIMGSTTTFGSGTWRFGLPKAPTPASGSTQVGVAFLNDSGTTTDMGCARIVSTEGFATIQIMATLNFVTPTTPWTWAQNDIIRITMNYQI